MRRGTSGGLVVVLCALALVGLAGPAAAHPLGNATVNHYDGLTVSSHHLTDSAVEDIAEIPTYQRKPRIDTNNDGTLEPVERQAYAVSQCADLARSLKAVVAGHRLSFAVLSSSYSEHSGAIDLTIGRLACQLRAPVDLSSATTLAFSDNWDGEGIGWHEITINGDGVSVRDSPFPSKTISDDLRHYPNDLLASPLDLRSGSVDVVPGGGLSSYLAERHLAGANFAVKYLNQLANTFNSVVGRKHLTVGVGLLAILLSLLLGAGHAFLPGHGKTIMAAYLVGRQGRLRDVVTVGATVTITHTAGVLVLGLLIASTSTFAPTAAEQLLGIISGLVVAGVGVSLFATAFKARLKPRLATALSPAPVITPALVGLPVGVGVGATTGLLETPAEHPHDHAHEHSTHEHSTHEHSTHEHSTHEHSTHEHSTHEHGKHGHVHPHPPGHEPELHGHRHGLFGKSHSHEPKPAGYSKAGLVGLGMAGGLVPSPSALLVLLAATALGRTVFGITLVLGYGLGMALALCTAGLLLVRLRGRLDRMASGTRIARADRLLAVLPFFTAVLVLAVGIGLALRAAGGQV